jgi:1-deoxy-D-xylulose-5-phosphate reductoisomerase
MVLVDPLSIVHALVYYGVGSVVAGLSVPVFRVRIAHCLGWPERLAWSAPRLDLAALGTLTFEAPDETRFPALRLAREALEAGGSLPTVLNAANEVAVEAFLGRKVGFTAIAGLVERVMEASAAERHAVPASISEAAAIDHIARNRARELLPEFAAKAS